MNMERGLNSLGQGQAPAVPPSLSSWGITELLENDPRPSFVLDLEDSLGDDSQRLWIIFSNNALNRHPRFARLIYGRTETLAEAHNEFSSFKAWTSGSTTSTLVYGGLRWSFSTLRKIWRIVSGNAMSHDASGLLANANGEAHPAASTPPTENKSTGEQRPLTSEKRLSRYGHADYAWADALPHNTHVEFFKDTDWSATPLGPLAAWSGLLRQVTQFLMADSRPACLCW